MFSESDYEWSKTFIDTSQPKPYESAPARMAQVAHLLFPCSAN